MMIKKILTYCIAVASLISCSRQEEIPLSSTDGAVTFRVDCEASDTKVMLNADLKTVWSGGDSVSVFYCGASTNTKAIFTGAEGSQTGNIVFSGIPGIETGTTFAALPYREDNAYFNDVIQSSIPAVQHYKKSSYDSDAALLVAATSTDELKFRYACSVVCVEVRPNGQMPLEIKAITLSATAGENIAGKVAVDMVSPDKPQTSITEEGSSSIELCSSDSSPLCTIEAGTSEKFYFCVAPTTLAAGYIFDILLTDETHVVSKNTLAESFETGTLLNTRCGISRPRSIIIDFNETEFSPALPKSAVTTTEVGSTFDFTNPADGKQYSICCYSLSSGFKTLNVNGYLCLRFNGVGDCLKIPSISGLKLVRFGAMVRQNSSKPMLVSSSKSDAGDIVPPVTYKNGQMTYSTATSEVDSPLYLYLPSNNTQISRLELYFE